MKTINSAIVVPMRLVRGLALVLLFVFATGAVTAWTAEEPCGFGQSEEGQPCSPFCLTCTCCAQPRVATTASVLPAPQTGGSPLTIVSDSSLNTSAREIPHVPKAALVG